jgi:hypothetical protein
LYATVVGFIYSYTYITSAIARFLSCFLNFIFFISTGQNEDQLQRPDTLTLATEQQTQQQQPMLVKDRKVMFPYYFLRDILKLFHLRCL